MIAMCEKIKNIELLEALDIVLKHGNSIQPLVDKINELVDYVKTQETAIEELKGKVNICEIHR